MQALVKVSFLKMHLVSQGLPYSNERAFPYISIVWPPNGSLGRSSAEAGKAKPTTTATTVANIATRIIGYCNHTGMLSICSALNRLFGMTISFQVNKSGMQNTVLGLSGGLVRNRFLDPEPGDIQGGQEDQRQHRRHG